MAASLVDARSDFPDLQRIGQSGLNWSTKTLSGRVSEYVAFNDPKKRFDGGVKEAVVHFHADTDQRLTAKQVVEVVRACAPRREGPCHYIISAEGYSEDFAALIEKLAGPQATVTLIDRSIMDAWNEDKRTIDRLAVAQHALADDRPSHMFNYEIGDPRDVDGVSGQFGLALYQVCSMVAGYHGDVDLADGVGRNWVEAPNDFHFDGQVTMALAGLDIAVGAVKGLFSDLGVDPEVTERTLEALRVARMAAAEGAEPDSK